MHCSFLSFLWCISTRAGAASGNMPRTIVPSPAMRVQRAWWDAGLCGREYCVDQISIPLFRLPPLTPPRSRSTGHQGPVVEVQDHGRIVILTHPVGKVRARLVLGGDEVQPQGADVGAIRELNPLDYLRPGEHGVASEKRRHMPAAVDAGDVESIGKPVEG